MDFTQPATDASLIKDATIETFAEDVMAASREVPVIVDFWAPWCGPCKTLGPTLEKAVTALAGKVKMVKIDIDQNQMLAQQLQIQSVPTVMAFIAGQPVDGFAGALPESQINSFLERVLQIAAQAGLQGGGGQGPSNEEILKAADEALEAGDPGTASQLYGQLAQMIEEDNAEKARAFAGLARCHAVTGNMDEAKRMLDMVPEAFSNENEVTSVKAMIDLASPVEDAGELGALKAAVQADPDNMEAQYALAEGLIGGSQFEEGSEVLLAMIKKDREWNEAAARQKLLTVFEALGPTNEITLSARRKLSSILFS